MSLSSFCSFVDCIVTATPGVPVHDHQFTNQGEPKFVRAELSHPATLHPDLDNVALTAAVKPLPNMFNEKAGVAPVAPNVGTDMTGIAAATQSRLNARRAEKNMNEKILAARRHNRGIPLAKLPLELRRQILKAILPDRRLFKPVGDSTFNKTIRSATRRGQRATKAREQEIQRRNHGEATEAAALVRGYDSVAEDQDSSFMDHEHGDSSCITQNFATTLMLIDSNIIGDVASSIMYEDQVFQVHISEKGVDFLNLPRIEHLQALQGPVSDISPDGAEIFGRDGPFRFGRMKHLDFHIYSETIGKASGFRMSQNIEWLVNKLLAEENGPHKISITFEPSLIHGHTVGEPLLNDFWVTKAGQGVRPRGSGLHGLSNIEFMTLPFEKLRNVARVEINLPGLLRDNAELLEFKVRVEGLMEGKTPKRTDLVAHEGALADAFDEWRYNERCKEMGGSSSNKKTVEEDKSWFLTDAEMMYDTDDAVSDFEFGSDSDSEENGGGDFDEGDES